MVYPGLREEGDPGDTERFYCIEELLTADDTAREPEIQVCRIRKAFYYNTLHKYLKIASLTNDADDELKQESTTYELRDGVLFNSEHNTPVLITLGRPHGNNQGCAQGLGSLRKEDDPRHSQATL